MKLLRFTLKDGKGLRISEDKFELISLEQKDDCVNMTFNDDTSRRGAWLKNTIEEAENIIAGEQTETGIKDFTEDEKRLCCLWFGAINWGDCMDYKSAYEHYKQMSDWLSKHFPTLWHSTAQSFSKLSGIGKEMFLESKKPKIKVIMHVADLTEKFGEPTEKQKNQKMIRTELGNEMSKKKEELKQAKSSKQGLAVIRIEFEIDYIKKLLKEHGA